MLHLLHVVEIAQRSYESILYSHQKFDAKIHLQEGEAHRHAFLKSLAHIASAAFGIRIAIAADFVAPFAAQELPYGYAPCLAADIPARELNSADAARLARITAELLYAAENLLDIAGVFAENAALEHRSIRAAGGIAYFAVTDEALVRVKLEECATLRCAVDVGKAHIGYLERRWIYFIDVHRSDERWVMSDERWGMGDE